MAVLAGVAVIVVAAFLPWGGSGTTERSSFEIVAIADRLDVVDEPLRSVARAWYAAPLVGAAAALAAATRRRALAEVAGTVVAAGGVALAVAVARSPLRALPGICVTIVGASMVVAGLVVGRFDRSRKERTPTS